MAGRIYRWVGGQRGRGITYALGVTSSNSVENFNWNNIYNWEEYVRQPNGTYRKFYGRVPSQQDTVVFGSLYTLGVIPFNSAVDSPELVCAPCLFGGFSGSIISGTWFNGFSASAGVPTSGGTYTSSLKEFVVYSFSNANYDAYTRTGFGNASGTGGNSGGLAFAYDLGYNNFPLGGGITSNSSKNLTFLARNFPNIGLTYNAVDGWTGSFFNSYTPAWDDLKIKAKQYNLTPAYDVLDVEITHIPTYMPSGNDVLGLTYTGGYTGAFTPVVKTNFSVTDFRGTLSSNGGYFKTYSFFPIMDINSYSGAKTIGRLSLAGAVVDIATLPTINSHLSGVSASEIYMKYPLFADTNPGITFTDNFTSSFDGAVSYKYTNAFLYPTLGFTSGGLTLTGLFSIQSGFVDQGVQGQTYLPGSLNYNKFNHYRAISEYDLNNNTGHYNNSYALINSNILNKYATRVYIGSLINSAGVTSNTNIDKLVIGCDDNYLPIAAVMDGLVNIDTVDIELGGRVSANVDSEVDIGTVNVRDFGTLDMRFGNFNLGVAGVTSTSGGVYGGVNFTDTGRILVGANDRLFNVSGLRKGTVDTRVHSTAPSTPTVID